MNAWGIFFRGLAMGAADIVPGVSGGTIAFITGVYPRLIAALHAVNTELLRLLWQRRFAAAWRHADGPLLLPLLLGILTAIFTLARLLSWLLVAYPLPLWSSFFGLIFGSVLMLAAHLPAWTLFRALVFVAGVALAAVLVWSPTWALPGGLFSAFIAGAIAICAMILPGISGSFILVLLGMYGTTLAAVRSLDFEFLACFASGAVVGLLSFSRLLHWLLDRHRATTLTALTGFLAGSLLAVWPWQLSEMIGGAVRRTPVWPWNYAVQTGVSTQWLLCLTLMLASAAFVWLVERGASSAKERDR